MKTTRGHGFPTPTPAVTRQRSATLITILSVPRTSYKATTKSKRGSAGLTRFEIDETTFAEITELIAASRVRALHTSSTVSVTGVF
jgi:hypothetical protein